MGDTFALPGRTSTGLEDRKSTRLNSSHTVISYAVFCLKKKEADVGHRPAGHAPPGLRVDVGGGTALAPLDVDAPEPLCRQCGPQPRPLPSEQRASVHHR